VVLEYPCGIATATAYYYPLFADGEPCAREWQAAEFTIHNKEPQLKGTSDNSHQPRLAHFGVSIASVRGKSRQQDMPRE